MNKSTKILAAGLIGFSLTGGTGLALAADDNTASLPELKVENLPDGTIKVTDPYSNHTSLYNKDGSVVKSNGDEEVAVEEREAVELDGTIANKPKAYWDNNLKKWVFTQNGPGNVQPANPEYTGPFYSLGEANVEPALPEGHPEAEKPEVKPDKKDNKKVEKKLPKTSAVK